MERPLYERLKSDDGETIGLVANPALRHVLDERIEKEDERLDALWESRRLNDLRSWKAHWVPLKYRDATFKTADKPEGWEEAFRELWTWAVEFPVESDRPEGIKSLLLSRDVNGVGKTHFSLCILNEILERRSHVAGSASHEFWPIYKLRQRVRAAERFGSSETPEDVIQRMGNISLLILDDIGKEQVSGSELGWTQELYFAIINERYNNDLPIVITANVGMQPWEKDGLTLAEVMGKAASSRLIEMTGGVQYTVKGEDRR